MAAGVTARLGEVLDLVALLEAQNGGGKSGVNWEFKIEHLASPFRLNKKARQRQRKLAKSLANEKALAKWDEATADMIRRIAKSTLKQANTKRGKNQPQNPK